MPVSREAELMKAALRHLVVPQLRRLGFSGKGSSFQRRGEWLDLLTIQFSKYGGEFILEFARMTRGDLQTSWGPVVPEEKLNVSYVNVRDRARLEQIGLNAGTDMRGFSFRHFGDSVDKYEALAQEVSHLLPQVEDYLSTKSIGPNIHAI